MGTGAVYVCLAGVDPSPPHGLRVIQTIFYFLNIALFLINTATLLLQLICASKPNSFQYSVINQLCQCIPSMPKDSLQTQARAFSFH